jgi:hypothetical protein
VAGVGFEFVGSISGFGKIRLFSFSFWNSRAWPRPLRGTADLAPQRIIESDKVQEYVLQGDDINLYQFPLSRHQHAVICRAQRIRSSRWIPSWADSLNLENPEGLFPFRVIFLFCGLLKTAATADGRQRKQPLSWNDCCVSASFELIGRRDFELCASSQV